MKKIIIVFIIFLIIFLLSCEKPSKEPNDIFFDVSFTALEGGEIVGKLHQHIQKSGSTTLVTAKPNNGYRFVSWSDGDKNIDKIIDNVESDLNISARFKELTYEYPTLYIITEDYKDITSKEEYINCTISVDDINYPEYNLNCSKARIKGRGNSTWGMPKKPYRIKFDEKTNLFGNGENKDWTLIANYCDPSQIRNYLAYSIGSIFDNLYYTT